MDDTEDITDQIQEPEASPARGQAPEPLSTRGKASEPPQPRGKTPEPATGPVDPAAAAETSDGEPAEPPARLRLYRLRAPGLRPALRSGTGRRRPLRSDCPPEHRRRASPDDPPRARLR